MISAIGSLCASGVIICLIWAGVAKRGKKSVKTPLLCAAVCFALTGVMSSLETNAPKTPSGSAESAVAVAGFGIIAALVFLVLYILEKKKRSAETQEQSGTMAALLEKNRELEEMQKRFSATKGQLENVTKMFSEADKRVDAAEKKLAELHYDDYAQVQAAIDEGNRTISANNGTIATFQSRIETLTAQESKLSAQNKTAANKLARLRELYKSADYSITAFFDADPSLERCKLPTADAADFDSYSPSVTLHLHSMDVKSLSKAFRDNDKQIESILEKYAGRYMIKANQAIYRLMVIALRAELQNILYNLKYEKLDVAKE